MAAFAWVLVGVVLATRAARPSKTIAWTGRDCVVEAAPAAQLT